MPPDWADRHTTRPADQKESLQHHRAGGGLARAAGRKKKEAPLARGFSFTSPGHSADLSR
jgi:hypothetical protein